LGIIFSPDSPRYARGRLDPEELNETNIGPELIGVFVNASAEEIINTVNEYGLQGIQLHGTETPEACKELRDENARLLILKAFSVDDTFDFATTAGYAPYCDFFLFDSSRAGGGKSFDWELMKKYKESKPFFLAGGLGVAHIDAVLKLAAGLPALAGIDASTRLERAPGLKDIRLVQSFIEGIRK